MAALSDIGIQLVENEDEGGDSDKSEKSDKSSDDEDSEYESGGNIADDDTGRTDDPVRMYLREMGAVELLSREGEIAIAKRIEAGREMMKGRNGSLLTLSYLGAERTMPNYNVMGMAKASLEAGVRYLATSLGPEGTRVNAISAGPIRTLAASGIKSFRKMLAHNAAQTPLRRNVTIEEVGNVGAFLCSDLASGMSGEITYVDGGFNITAMGGLED